MSKPALYLYPKTGEMLTTKQIWEKHPHVSLNTLRQRFTKQNCAIASGKQKDLNWEELLKPMSKGHINCDEEDFGEPIVDRPLGKRKDITEIGSFTRYEEKLWRNS